MKIDGGITEIQNRKSMKPNKHPKMEHYYYHD